MSNMMLVMMTICSAVVDACHTAVIMYSDIMYGSCLSCQVALQSSEQTNAAYCRHDDSCSVT